MKNSDPFNINSALFLESLARQNHSVIEGRATHINALLDKFGGVAFPSLSGAHSSFMDYETRQDAWIEYLGWRDTRAVAQKILTIENQGFLDSGPHIGLPSSLCRNDFSVALNLLSNHLLSRNSIDHGVAGLFDTLKNIAKITHWCFYSFTESATGHFIIHDDDSQSELGRMWQLSLPLEGIKIGKMQPDGLTHWFPQSA